MNLTCKHTSRDNCITAWLLARVTRLFFIWHWTLFYFVFSADEDLRWPVPSGALHGLHHRSFHGVPASRLPQTLPRDVALHLRDRDQKGMSSCTHTHTVAWLTSPQGSLWLHNPSDMSAVLRRSGRAGSGLYLIFIYFSMTYTCSPTLQNAYCIFLRSPYMSIVPVIIMIPHSFCYLLISCKRKAAGFCTWSGRPVSSDVLCWFWFSDSQKCSRAPGQHRRVRPLKMWRNIRRK